MQFEGEDGEIFYAVDDSDDDENFPEIKEEEFEN